MVKVEPSESRVSAVFSKADAITLEVGIYENLDGQLRIRLEETAKELDELIN